MPRKKGARIASLQVGMANYTWMKNQRMQDNWKGNLDKISHCPGYALGFWILNKWVRENFNDTQARLLGKDFMG